MSDTLKADARNFLWSFEMNRDTYTNLVADKFYNLGMTDRLYCKHEGEPGPVYLELGQNPAPGEYLIEAGKTLGTAFLIYKKDENGDETLEPKTFDEMLEGDKRLTGVFAKPEKPKLGFFSWLRHKLSFIFGEPEAIKAYDRQMEVHEAKKMDLIKQDFSYDKFEYDADLTNEENANAYVGVRRRVQPSVEKPTIEVPQDEMDEMHQEFVNDEEQQPIQEPQTEQKTHQKTTIIDLNKAAALKLLNRVKNKTQANTLKAGGADILIGLIGKDDPACGDLVKELGNIQGNIDLSQNDKDNNVELDENVVENIEDKVGLFCVSVSMHSKKGEVGKWLNEEMDSILPTAETLQKAKRPAPQERKNNIEDPQIGGLKLNVPGE